MASSSDLYAFPYFHAGDNDVPEIYQLFLNREMSGQNCISPYCTHNVHSTVDYQKTMDSNSCWALQILTRCITHPKELSWSDSCGDTILHQLSQFPPVTNIGNNTTKNDPLRKSFVLFQKRKFRSLKMMKEFGNDLFFMKNIPFITHAGILAAAVLDASPNLATEKNKWGETPLHNFASHCGLLGTGVNSRSGFEESQMACKDHLFFGELLKLLITFDPKSPSAQNYLNRIPLHNACEVGKIFADHNYLQQPNRFVFDASKKHHKYQMEVVRKLIDAHPDGLFHADHKSLTPLHVALMYDSYCPVDVIRLLLEEIELDCGAGHQGLKNIICGQSSMNKYSNDKGGCIRSSTILCGTENSPLAIFWESHSSKFSFLRDHIPQQEKQQSELWQKTVLLIRAAYHGSVIDTLPTGETFRLVHAAAGVGCPPAVMKFCVQLHPEQTCEVDIYGQMPLAIAMTASFTDNGEDDFVKFHEVGPPPSEITYSTDFSDLLMSSIQILLHCNPKAAGLVDHEGRLPLHIGLSSGKTWDCMSPIFKAEPRAVSIRDPKTLLFPFMIAAVGNKSRLDDEDDFFQDAKLATIFLALREDPSVCLVL